MSLFSGPILPYWRVKMLENRPYRCARKTCKSSKSCKFCKSCKSYKTCRTCKTCKSGKYEKLVKLVKPVKCVWFIKLRTKNPRQAEVLEAKGEAFCDDNGIASTSAEDLSIFDSTCRRYEESSGAKLSRNKKSKILFLGACLQTKVTCGLPARKGRAQSFWLPGDS